MFAGLWLAVATRARCTRLWARRCSVGCLLLTGCLCLSTFQPPILPFYPVPPLCSLCMQQPTLCDAWAGSSGQHMPRVGYCALHLSATLLGNITPSPALTNACGWPAAYASPVACRLRHVGSMHPFLADRFWQRYLPFCLGSTCLAVCLPISPLWLASSVSDHLPTLFLRLFSLHTLSQPRPSSLQH